MAKTYTIRFGSGDPRQYAGLSPTMLIFVNLTNGATLVAPSITESLSVTCGIYQFSYGTTQPIAFLADAATTSPGTTGRYVTGQIDPADRSDEYGNTLVALGTTNVAIGTSHLAQGVTIIAIGTSGIAQGVSIISQGVTITAIGTTLLGYGASSVAFGTTIIAIGTTLFGQGVTNIAIGTSNLAQGLTTLGYGVSIYARVQATGTSVTAMGDTLAGIGISLSIISSVIGSTASSFGDSSTDPATLFGYMKRIQENLEGDSQYVKVSGVWTILDRTGGTTFVQKTITNSATLVVKT